jgi:hypothetical protein
MKQARLQQSGNVAIHQCIALTRREDFFVHMNTAVDRLQCPEHGSHCEFSHCIDRKSCAEMTKSAALNNLEGARVRCPIKKFLNFTKMLFPCFDEMMLQ